MATTISEAAPSAHDPDVIAKTQIADAAPEKPFTISLLGTACGEPSGLGLLLEYLLQLQVTLIQPT